MEYQISGLRYEIKMECDQFFMPQVESWVNAHPAGFRKAYPARWVNSVYLDTNSLDTLNDHMDGVPVRRKFRFRWYGEDLAFARGQFEIKNKNERVGWKLIQPVDRTFDLQTSSWYAIHQQMLEYLETIKSNLFLELLKVSRPLVLIRYYRDYYVSGDGHIRLTIDSRQKAYDQWMAAYPNLTFQLPGQELIVTELKTEVSNARNMANLLAEFPLRARRHSKFVSAVSSLLDR